MGGTKRTFFKIKKSISSDENSENDTAPEPEPEPECIVKTNEEFENELWTIVPLSCGVFFSVTGKEKFNIRKLINSQGFVLIGIDNRGRLAKAGADRRGLLSSYFN
jgi:hypothetical protein